MENDDLNPVLILETPSNPPGFASPELFNAPSNPRLFEVTNTNASGSGSLKQAFVDASLYPSDDCAIIFSSELFSGSDYLKITLDESAPIGSPRGKIFLGLDLTGRKKLILDFGDNSPIYASNAEIQLCFYNTVFLNCSRTGNPVCYSSYTGGNETFFKFEKCAFVDFSTDSRLNIWGTSGSSQTSAEFKNCVFVPANNSPSTFGLSWIGKSSNISRFEHCTIYYPATASGIPLSDIGENGKNNLILSSVDLSGESWFVEWSARNSFGEPGRAPTIENNKTISFFASITPEDKIDCVSSSLVDYWGETRESSSAFGAIRETFVASSLIRSIENALKRNSIGVSKVFAEYSGSGAKAGTISDCLQDLCNYIAPTVPTFPEGSYIWKTATAPNYLDLPLASNISDSDISFGEADNFSSSGFDQAITTPNNCLYTLADYLPGSEGKLEFKYESSIIVSSGVPVSFVKITNGGNVLTKHFWLPPFFSASSPSVSVVIGDNWKDQAGNTPEGFNGCNYSSFKLSENVFAVSGIYEDYISNSSIKFYQVEDQAIVYFDENGEDVTNDLKSRNLIVFTPKDSFLSNVFGDLAQTALYSLNIPLEKAQADYIF